MDYQAYKKEFLESLRNDSAINGRIRRMNS